MYESILWVSDRQMSEEAYTDLKRIYGNVAIKLFDKYYTDEDGYMRWNWENIFAHSRGFDIIAMDDDVIWGNYPVYEELTKPENNTKPVIRSISHFVNDEYGGSYKHERWEQVMITIKKL